MFTSWSEVSTPGAVVDGVGVDPAAVAGELDPAELGQAQVAALADDLDPQVVAVDPDARRWPCRRRRRCDSVEALTYVPMPPFHSRSTGAWRIAFISSAGRHLGDLGLDAERRRASAALIGIDLAVRG